MVDTPMNASLSAKLDWKVSSRTDDASNPANSFCRYRRLGYEWYRRGSRWLELHHFRF